MAAYPIPAATPSALHPSVQTFLSHHYQSTDNPTGQDAWVDAFAPDAVFILASMKRVGREGGCSPSCHLAWQFLLGANHAGAGN